REKLFTAASQGDGAQLHGLLDFLQLHRKRLTSPEFKDESNGKTVLLKAFLNLKDGRNDTIEVLMDIAEKTLDSESFINAAYTDPSYKGQTALHVAIERRSLHYVKLLVQKGADVQAKASGTFFQRNTKLGFYFGELPLSLAACTNQPEVVSFLLENPHRRADPTDRDSQGNTVLHIQNNLGSTFSCKSVQNRPEMLQIEPLRSLLQDKWQRFASKLFLLNFLSYLLYLAVFTTAAFYRKDGQPPFPVENVPADHLRCLGEIISVLGAITIFRRNPPNISSLFTDGFTEILFFLQAALLLLCAVLYCCGRTEYVGLLVLSLALAWMNVLYYTRGSRQLGIYNVMMQRMILGDLLHFLCVYIVLLFGFSAVDVSSAAVCTLIDDSPGGSPTNDSVPRQRSFNVETFKCEKPSYNDIGFTTLELFKFTIGMGDLEFTDHVQNQTVFYVLLICYIVLTYILMLNMLIALMGNTVERIKEQSQTIWNLQVEDSPANSYFLWRFVSFRVTEINWKKWRSDVGVKLKEEPAGQLTTARTEEETSGKTSGVPSLLFPVA
uniref:Transient receptor potential cation channel subfamily V member 1-like n=1 Tax=Poecilia latipinna TaxID=48699 RepID=A0A3B3TQY9_9TELE